MKRIWIIILMFAIIVGAYAVLNNIFPKAPPIDDINTESITEISLTQNNTTSFKVKKEDYNSLVQSINNATPTRKMSVNDYPTTNLYFTVEICTLDKTSRYFVYEENSHTYIEIPYEGIYETNREFIKTLSKENKTKKTVKVTENSVSGIGGEAFEFPVEISGEDANSLSQIINNCEWKECTFDDKCDYTINLKGHLTYYNSTNGTLTRYNLAQVSTYSSKVQEIDAKSSVLSEEDKVHINAILKKYIT